MSSLSRKLVIYRVLFAWAFLAFAALPLSTANADKAQTGGFSGGGGAGAGYGGTVAGAHFNSSSDAKSTGRHSAEGVSDTGSKIGVVQGGYGAQNRVQLRTSAYARATSTKKKIEAYAKAKVVSSANSVETAGTADTAAAAEAEAYASYDNKEGATAYAASMNGAYAYANTASAVTVSYVPDGTTQTVSKGKLTASISYTALGSFSIAWTSGKKAGAVAGTTENTAALAAGNIRAAIKSATLASAEASPKYASAFASATVDAMASNSAGFAQAYGHSEAYASVTRTKDKMRIAVATTTNINKCGDHWWLKKKHRKECVVQIRTVSLK